MKQVKIIMGMPITIEIVDLNVSEKHFDIAFDYFRYVDDKFSTYKNTSEVMLINHGALKEEDYSDDMKEVLALSLKTKNETENYFNIRKSDGTLDPSGLVKGWAIHKVGEIFKRNGLQNFCIEAGGDIQTSGLNSQGKPWTVGIRNPFKTDEIVKILESKNRGIATSGNYIRGEHIYNPKNERIMDIVSMTVIGPDIYEADRFATAAFAMGEGGIVFIENLPGFEGYMINDKGLATMTSGFKEYVK